ncbi:hypothetical protein PAAG_11429 [Paracoccidioides lutzii Pb01]|uniref:Neutral protease 2 n=1 Tax=Paracoccidioides lutzii (strain ATCC MYA-826 / Pb01) TaxID=502779 RepID=A0A0A2V2Y5_PARBA|nr:hypothetical protein PAAG_11429 [Paracoccidioides lutzii Pb01]KGQ01853.1 hypothetical protein PAAG_11429 [Paracoccidioides lutzii Pb01]
MRRVSGILVVAAFITSTFAGVIQPVAKDARDSEELDVKLTQVDGTVIKAVTLLQSRKSPSIVKVLIDIQESHALRSPFGGIRVRHKTSDLSSDVITHLAPGESFEDEFDVAFTSDLSQGGPIVLQTQGYVPTTDTGGKTLSGVVRYKSNKLEIDVDGTTAAKSFAAMNQFAKIAKLSSCEGSQGDDTRRALRDCASLSTLSAAQAWAGGPKMMEYFKANDETTRKLVADRFTAIALESSNLTGGSTTYYCRDPYNICTNNIIAYTIPAENLISNCPIYYTEFDNVNRKCHGQDRVTTSLHEFTHAPSVFSPGTKDIAYGYDACILLSTRDALNNADTFALFAQCELLSPDSVLVDKIADLFDSHKRRVLSDN